MGHDIPAIPTPSHGPDAERSNIIRELMETERKYVQDLEVMQVRMSWPSRPFAIFMIFRIEICPGVITKQYP